GAAGIGDGDRMVGYDDVGGWVAARLWWMLDNLGFGRRGVDGEWVGVLDGGIKAWVEAGQPLSRDVPRAPRASRLTRAGLADAWHGVIERDELRSRLGSVTLLDAPLIGDAAGRPAGPDHVRRVLFGLESIGRAGRHWPGARGAAGGERWEEGGHMTTTEAMAPSAEIRDTVLEFYRRMLAGEADEANELISRDPAVIFIG